MGVLPEVPPGGVTGRGRRRLLLSSALVLGGIAAGWWWSDQLAARIFAFWRPRIEHQVGQAMGHPLRLGPFQGLGPWGVGVGPSQLLPVPADPSSVRVERFTISLQPLESLRRGVPVLALRLQGASAALRRNAKGQYWTLGPHRPGGQPPPLALSISLADAAAVQIEPAGPTAGVRGRVDLNLKGRRVDLRGSARLKEVGAVQFDGGGSWGSGDWRGSVTTQELALANLAQLLPQLPKRAVPLSGRVRGAITLERRGAPPRCKGQLRMEGLRLRPTAAATVLRADGLDLRCSGQTVTLASAPWSYGTWSGTASLKGPWRQPLASIEARHVPAPRRLLAPAPLLVRADLDLDGRQRFRLGLRSLQLRSGAAIVRARGSLWPRLEVNTQQLSLTPDLWRQTGWGPPLLGTGSAISGELSLVGSALRPAVKARLVHPRTPLLEQVAANLAWSGGTLRLESLRSPDLSAHGTLPLALDRQGAVKVGEANLSLTVPGYRLARLSPLVGTHLQGELGASGRVLGPINGLRPDLALRVRNPGAGPLRILQLWEGRLRPRQGGGGLLDLARVGSGGGTRLEAQLDRRWLPGDLLLSRDGGSLRLLGSPRRYRWTAKAFPLDGLQLALGVQPHYQSLYGRLQGRGVLDLQPLLIEGSARVDSPAIAGLQFRTLSASGGYQGHAYTLRGQALPKGSGQVSLSLRGVRGGPIWSRVEARGLDSDFFQQLNAAVAFWRGGEGVKRGRASDLGTLAIDTLGGSLQEQLAALDIARAQVARVEAQFGGRRRRLGIWALRGLVDADLTVRGPSIRQLNLDLAAKGHLWLEGDDRDLALGLEPFVARLKGPLGGGAGSFSLEHLPLSLLVLATPVPAQLQGAVSLRGRYRLGSGSPSVGLDLALEKAVYRGQPVSLDRGHLELARGLIQVDLSLHAGEARNSIDLVGSVPLDPEAEGLKLRLASRGDGLGFLTSFGGDGLQWRKGNADLQLLVRGSLLKPLANGFLRLQNGELVAAGQAVRDLDATVLFDFEELEVQQFSARIGEEGTLSAGGHLSLFKAAVLEKPLKLTLRKARFSNPRLSANGDADLLVGGSLLGPVISGEIQLSKGSINIRPGQLAKADPATTTATPAPVAAVQRPVTVDQLIQEKWDFRQPLVLLGQQVPSAGTDGVSANLPNLPFVSFDRLRLRLGPDLRVVVPNVLNFNTGGLLTLGGKLDSSLRATGVVRLKSGRLGLFTTTFTLDPDSPNVAVFTPALGLIPYLDVALRTRVSDSITATIGGDRGSINDLNPNRSVSALDQLNLVKVVVKISGPADRIGQSIQLRSNPPLSQERLVALIGGNSLAGLSGGNAGAALATVVGQSLLSPLVSTLTDALGQRVSFALYPTFVAPTVDQPSENRSRRVPSQLVLGSEIGLDLSERFNFSVLAAPNRSDVPPQMTLRYQASDKLGLQGSVDTQGRWQTQLQMFLRF